MIINVYLTKEQIEYYENQGIKIIEKVEEDHYMCDYAVRNQPYYKEELERDENGEVVKLFDDKKGWYTPIIKTVQVINLKAANEEYHDLNNRAWYEKHLPATAKLVPIGQYKDENGQLYNFHSVSVFTSWFKCKVDANAFLSTLNNGEEIKLINKDGDLWIFDY